VTSTLRVAAVQLELRPEPDLDHYLAHLATVVSQAADAGAELVVLPELASTGLLASHPDAATLRVADVVAAYRQVFPPCIVPIGDVLRDLATSHEVTVLGGSHYRKAGDGTYRNTALLAHADGRLEQQDKLHLTPQEQAMGTTPGDDVLVTRIGPARAAIQICADVEFPEVSRHLALEGVDLVLCPSLTWNRRGAQRIRYSSHARALENQLFVVTAPLVGTCGVPADGAIHGTGTALVAAPIDRTFGLDDGVVVEHEDTRAEGMVVADLDLDLIATSRARPEPPGLSNVRPELYARLAGRLGTPSGDADDAPAEERSA
jgi:predicted amidohydrolase